MCVYDDMGTDEIHTLEFFGATNALSGSKDGTICIWRCHDWLCLHTVKGEHKAVVNDIAVHNSGRLALSVAGDRTLILWDLTKGKPAYKTKLSNMPKRVYWSPHCNLFVVQFDSQVQVYSADTGNSVKSIHFSSKIRDVLFLTERIIVAGCEDSCFRICDLQDRTVLRVLKTGHTKRIRSIGLIDNPPQQEGQQKKIRKASFVFDGVTLALAKKREMEGVAIGDADGYIVSADSNGVVALWDINQMVTEAEFSSQLDMETLKQDNEEQEISTDEFGNPYVEEPEPEDVTPVCTLLAAADSRVTALATSHIIPQHIESKKEAAKEAMNAAKKRKATKPAPSKQTTGKKQKVSAEVADKKRKDTKKKGKGTPGKKQDDSSSAQKNPQKNGVVKDGVVSFVDSRQLSKLREGQKRKQKRRPRQVFQSNRVKKLKMKAK